jgi:predicted Zn-dependent peptidase
MGHSYWYNPHRTIVVIAGNLALPALRQGVDPLIGSWKINFEKSTFVNNSQKV